MITFTPNEVSAYYEERLPQLRQQGSEWRCGCPVHQGKDPNFAVDPSSGRAFCHSRCGRGWDIISLEQELTGSDFERAKSRVFEVVGRITTGDAAHPVFAGVPEYSWRYLKRKIEAYEKEHALRRTHTFYYTHPDGRLAFVKVRFQDASGKKSFQKYAMTAKGGWSTPKKTGVPLLLYRFHLLANSEEIHICNGEKAADAGAEKLGLTTTCLPDGEAKWKASFTAHFVNKRVVAYIDNDATGQEHGRVVAANLAFYATSLRLIRLPGLRPKGDLFDWIEGGGTAEQLREIINATEPVDPESIESINQRVEAEAGGGGGVAVAEAGDPPIEWVVDDGGVFFGGGEHRVRICSRLDVVAYTRDSNAEGWGRLLRWHDPEGNEHTWAMPMSMLAGDGGEYRARLLEGGLVVEPGREARRLLERYLQSAAPGTFARCVTRVGWHGQVFVLPGGIVGVGSSENVLLQSSAGEHYLRVSGTTEEWQAEVGRLCSGNTRLILAVSAAFAGPLLEIAHAESGGIHLIGGSTIGKTTALIVGGSVCGGGGKDGFVRSWRATSNGLEGIAELHNHLTLFLDELAQVDPREAAEVAYMLANGVGKERMSRSIGTRKKFSWTLLFLSSGEVTLADHAQAAGKRTKGGAEVRLLNVAADAGAGMGLFEDIHGFGSADAFSRHVKNAARRCYGAPLRAFIEFICRSRDQIEKAVANFQKDFLAKHVPHGASGEVFRAAARFALLAAAGELATEAGITGWAAGDADKAISSCFKSWLETRGTTGAIDIERAIQQVIAFLESNGASRFQAMTPRTAADGSVIPEKVINRAGFRDDDAEGGSVYYILPEAFRRDVCGGFNHQQVEKALRERGHLITEPGRMKKPRLPELGTTWVYAVKSAILGGSQ